MKTDDRTTQEAHEGRSLHNRKPYRTEGQILEARRLARKERGTYVSPAPVSYHAAPRGA